MSRVEAHRCDFCGKESRDRKGWASVTASCTGLHSRGYDQQNAYINQVAGGRQEVVIRFPDGDPGFEFTSADLCSMSCAGAFLFRLPKPKEGA